MSSTLVLHTPVSPLTDIPEEIPADSLHSTLLLATAPLPVLGHARTAAAAAACRDPACLLLLLRTACSEPGLLAAACHASAAAAADAAAARRTLQAQNGEGFPSSSTGQDWVRWFVLVYIYISIIGH